MVVMADLRLEHWRYRLDKPVGGSGVSVVDVLIAEIEADTGEIGLGVSYALQSPGEVALAAARSLAERFLARGTPLLHPLAHWRRMVASFNRTGRGQNMIGLAAIDLALWDLHAKRLGLPLGVAMGGEPRAVPVYGSGGFGPGMAPDVAAENARSYLARGLKAVKPRATTGRADIALLRAVRDALPHDCHLMTDANEKLTPAQALFLLQAGRELGLLWVEEPLPARDLPGHRALARAAGAPIATGEHLMSCEEALPFAAEGIAAVLQPDLAAMGWTESWRLCQLAEHLNVEVAPHFLPGLFVHLAAASPAVTWLEDFPLLEPLFAGLPGWDEKGRMSPPDRPGHGLSLADGAREAFRVGG